MGLFEDCACGSSLTFLQEFVEFIRCEMLHPDRELRADCDRVKVFLTTCLEKGDENPEYWAFPDRGTIPRPLEAHDAAKDGEHSKRKSSSRTKRTRFT